MSAFGFGELHDGGNPATAAFRTGKNAPKKKEKPEIIIPDQEDPDNRLNQPRGVIPQGMRSKVDPGKMRLAEGTVENPGNAPSIDPNKDLWVETRSPAGKVYFYNAKTRKTAWSRPKKAQVISQQQFLALAISQTSKATGTSGSVSRLLHSCSFTFSEFSSTSSDASNVDANGSSSR